MKNRFSFSWNWSHFIENAQDWTYASSPGMQDWDNIRTARGGILNWTYSKSSATVISASVSANQWLNVQETTGVRKYKPSDIGFPTYLDARCQALGGCAVPLVTWNGYTSAYGGNSLVMGRTLSADVRQRSHGSQGERVACPWLTLYPGRYRFPAGLRNQYRRRRKFHGEFHLQ